MHQILLSRSNAALFSSAPLTAAAIRGTLLILGLIFLTFTSFAQDRPYHAKRFQEPDLRVFRPSNAIWYSRSASDEGAFSAVRFGTATDVPVPADYDGDGDIDIAAWRPDTGVWFIERSSDGNSTNVQWGTSIARPTGMLADMPVPADYDGDGKADVAVWRSETGVWYILNSSDEFAVSKAKIFQWGKSGDVPVPADYDGDGKTDAAFFRSSENNWYILKSGTGKMDVRTFGIAGLDTLVPADYTGDGKADLAVFRQGVWYVLNSKTGETEPFKFGYGDSIPVPADYDGDGETDFAVFRRGIWYINESSGSRFVARNFGLDGDVPLNSLRARPSIIGLP